MDALDAYDLHRHAQLFAERVLAAQRTLEATAASEQERGWLAQSAELVARNLARAEHLISEGRLLPELLPVRSEFAEGFQSQYVDALEKLHAGITFHAGSRTPLIETLFPHLKFVSLRKAGRDGILEYHAEFQRRLKLSYTQRQLAEQEFQFAPVVLEQVQAAYMEWETSFSDVTLNEDRAHSLRNDFASLAQDLELNLRQARLLSEAAMAALSGSFEEHNLGAKMRRTRRGTAE